MPRNYIKVFGERAVRLVEDRPLYQNERPFSGARGTRTPDPLLAKQMRYQLRYSPVCYEKTPTIRGWWA